MHDKETVLTLRLFIFADGEEVAAITAAHVPRVGDDVWFKTVDTEMTVTVERVEHQMDRSTAATYSTHDVCLYCRKK